MGFDPKVYRYRQDFGKMGTLQGLFVIREKSGEILLEALLNGSAEPYYGEALGKHSEIYDKLKREDVKLILEMNPDAIQALCEGATGEEWGQQGELPWVVLSGHCPLSGALNAAGRYGPWTRQQFERLMDWAGADPDELDLEDIEDLEDEAEEGEEDTEEEEEGD